MMLIATGLAAALIAAASFAPDPVETRGDSTSVMLPPIVISVFSGPGITASLVSRILAETSAIWRPGGFEIVWRRATRDVLPYTRRTETGAYEPSTLRVVIGDDRGASSDNRTPLGWITFDDEHEPQREIYLSYANAKALMAAARAVVGVMDQMPPTQREVMLGRAMGRALAHELGHYLLASKVHTARGLLKASRTATELFSIDRAGFKIDVVQRQQIVARLRGDSQVVSR